MEVPPRLLGLSYTSWTKEDLRIVLNHYGVATPANLNKRSLMHELGTLATQRGLTDADRRAILRNHRARVPSSVQTQILPGTTDISNQPVAPLRSNYAHLASRRQQRRDHHVRRRRDRRGQLVPGPPRRQEDRIDAATAASFSPNVRNTLRTQQTIHNRPVHTDSNQIEHVQPSHGSDGFAAAMSPEPLQDTANTGENLRDCRVCLESLGQGHFPGRRVTASCDHDVNVCSVCLSRSISAQLRNKSWKQINCDICGAQLEFKDVKEFADGETFESYENLVLQACLSDGQFQKCRMNGCPSSQEYHEGDSYIICHQCGGRTCTSCDIPWHPDLSCAEVVRRRSQAQAAEEAAASEYLSTNTKLCPNCGIRGTKVHGCDHIICPQCRHQYCWVCLADFRQIRELGNTAHESDCRHHSDNLPDGEVPRNPAACRAVRWRPWET